MAGSYYNPTVEADEAASSSIEKKAPSVTEEVVSRVSRTKLNLFFIGALVTVFVTNYQAVVPASFFVQAVGPWGVDVSSLWMLASYLIGYVSFILPTYRVSELSGRLSAFLFGLVVFVIFTGVAGHSKTAYTFAVLRALQGAGAGILASISVLVVATNASHRSRSLYVAGLCAAQLFGVGAAHVIGGKLADDGKFRWSIYLAAPLVAAPLVLCTPALWADKKPVRTESVAKSILRFDYAGTLLLFGTVIMLTMGLVFGGNEHKWNTAIVICLIVFGCVGIAAFLLWEKYMAHNPIFNIAWLHEHNLQVCVVNILFMSMVFFALAVYVPILYITARMQSTSEAGKRSAPYWGASMGAALLAGVALRFRVRLARPLVWAGLIISIVFSGLYYTIPAEATSESKEKAYYALAGLGIGLAYSAISYLAQISVPLEEVGAAAVVGHFLSIVGGMLGLILYQACLKSRLIINLDAVFKSNVFLSAFNVRTMDIAGLEVAGGTLKQYVPDMVPLIGEKLVMSLHTTYILTVPFLGAALLMTLLYKHHRNPAV
ncbi:hypothetical protein LPJ53_001050 [Coemansia erecta]|uniref:MFS general substrate transporter n=1 Tax=Coemansia erecta TaxID=147472 RepID=A0A9W8CT72_9FUNG|nr:hypothetical protein LPJ53_001050 [Coemansia erecta]